MNPEEQARWADQVAHTGKMVAKISRVDRPGISDRLYGTMESRGHKAPFEMYFYLITMKSIDPIGIIDVTKDKQRRGIKKYWHKNGFDCEIFDKQLFNQWSN